MDSTGKGSAKANNRGVDPLAAAGVDSFAEALCVGEVVIAFLPSHGRWKRANVVDIRRRRSSSLNGLFDTTAAVKTEEELVDGPEGFDYYVHYEQMNRRHDRWITWSEIRLITDSDSGDEDEDDEDEDADEDEVDEDGDDDDEIEENTVMTRRQRLNQSSSSKRKLVAPPPPRRSTRGTPTPPVKDEDEDKEEEEETSSSLSSELEYSDESDHEGMNETDIAEWEKATKVKRIDKILIGGSVMETWYWSPFPSDFQDVSLLYICEYCLAFFREKAEFQWHCAECKFRHPPGDEIYCDPTGNPRMSVFEVDGFFERVYCENLCYLSKLFLDHKRFDRFDVSNFYFYVVGEWMDVKEDKMSSSGFRFIGYFSKEKQATNRNLSCIMSLPCYQRRGFGSFIIELSYEISKIAKRMGTPERPLSDLGKRTYLRWWLQRILRVLRDREDAISISEISKLTYILPDDIKATLEEYKLLYYYKGQYHIALPPDRLKLLWVDDNPDHVRVNPIFLHWTPLELPDPNVEL